MDAESTAPTGNRLAAEKSPYLRQHEQNPVDWYPWGPEALARARETGRPIFLSIGYSTCHWCHVMAHESFENEAIAKILNESFVPIKVDREERPDLDQLYMTAVQVLTSAPGGWPLSVFLTPDLEPFYGGTYFPPEDRWGRPGFKTLLARIAQLWQDDRDGLTERGRALTHLLQDLAPRTNGGDLSAETLTAAFEQMQAAFDKKRGGFGDAPKFPVPHGLTFLLRYAHRSGDDQALAIVRATLDAMASGGIRDHLGGGFHRYATDAEWRIPHFEKMLYDQAGLAIAYTDAYLVTGDPAYAAIVREVLDYVLLDLQAPAGGFYSAEDADSEGTEGTFYVWTADELNQHLGPDLGARFAECFSVRPQGNWEGRNILYRDSLRPSLAPPIAEARRTLHAVRSQRARPHRDEKILVAWNGYMIAALCRAGRALGEMRYVRAAEGAAAVLREQVWHTGRLQRFYLDGAATTPAYLDDYAFLGRGLLALYETTYDPRQLAEARHVADEMVRLFARADGGFNMSGHDAEELLAPVVDFYDGAMPSGNAAASHLLLRLGHLLADRAMEERGRQVLRVFAGSIAQAPRNHLALLAALDFALGPVTEVVIAAPSHDPTIDASLRAMILPLWERYMPNSVSAVHAGADAAGLTELIPYIRTQGMSSGQVTAYLCHNYACRQPVLDAGALAQQLDGR